MTTDEEIIQEANEYYAKVEWNATDYNKLIMQKARFDETKRILEIIRDKISLFALSDQKPMVNTGWSNIENELIKAIRSGSSWQHH